MDWLEEDVLLSIHEAQIAEHGGASGIRDRSLLLSALARPRNAASHVKADIPHLAALYALAIIKNHPFVDGNKRVGAVVLNIFLELHDFELEASDADLVVAILRVADGAISDKDFIRWVGENISAARA